MPAEAAVSEVPGDATVVHLLRHGEVHNPDGILYGRLSGYHLSELGGHMATLAAEHLQSHDVVHVASSPLERAVQTARAVADSHHLGIHLDGRLIEAGNAFEGLPVAGGASFLRDPRHWAKLVDPIRPSWGEAYISIADRMLAAVDDVRAAAAGHEAVMVSHQLPIWTLRCRLEGRRLWHDPRRRECALASLTSLHFHGTTLDSITYVEPAKSLLPRASAGVGA